MEPSALQPGVVAYEQADTYLSYLAGGYAVGLSIEAGQAILLAPLQGGPGKRAWASGIDLKRYKPGELGQQSSLVLVAGSNEPCPAGVHAFDPHTLEGRWNFVPNFEWQPDIVVGVERAGRLALRFSRGVSLEVDNPRQTPNHFVLLDATTGKPLWQRTVPSIHLPAGMAGHLLVYDTSRSLAAWSIKDGRDVWRAELGHRYPPLTTSDEVLATIIRRRASAPPDSMEDCRLPTVDCNAVLWIIDPATGKTRQRIELGPQIGDIDSGSVRIADRDIFVEAPTRIHELDATRLIAFDARTGAERWSTRAFPCKNYLTQRPPLHVTPSLLYACTCDGVLRVLSRADGRIRSELGVGECSDFLLFGERVVSAEAIPGDHGITLLDLDAMPGPKQVKVQGQVVLEDPQLVNPNHPLRFPRWVRLGPEVIKTDGRGTFRTTIRGRGVYSVDLAFTPYDDGYFEMAGAAISFERGGTQRLELGVQTASH